jgi:hypothetical protein
MFGKRADYNISNVFEFLGFVADVADLDPDLGDFLASSAKPDIFIPFQRSDDPRAVNDPFYGSDDIALLAYHETAHALQFDRFGSDWWSSYVTYIISAGTVHREECRPYGHQELAGHGLAELTEGMAEVLSLYYAD